MILFDWFHLPYNRSSGDTLHLFPEIQCMHMVGVVRANVTSGMYSVDD